MDIISSVCFFFFPMRTLPSVRVCVFNKSNSDNVTPLFKNPSTQRLSIITWNNSADGLEWSQDNYSNSSNSFWEDQNRNTAQLVCYFFLFVSRTHPVLSTLYSGTTDALNMISCENESLTTKVFQEESKRNLPLRGSPRKRNNGEKNMEGSGVPSVPPQHCHLRKINSLNFMDLFANPKNKN